MGLEKIKVVARGIISSFVRSIAPAHADLSEQRHTLPVPEGDDVSSDDRLTPQIYIEEETPPEDRRTLINHGTRTSISIATQMLPPDDPFTGFVHEIFRELTGHGLSHINVVPQNDRLIEAQVCQMDGTKRWYPFRIREGCTPLQELDEIQSLLGQFGRFETSLLDGELSIMPGDVCEESSHDEYDADEDKALREAHDLARSWIEGLTPTTAPGKTKQQEDV